MAITRPGFADDLDPAIRTVFFDRYNEEPQMMPSIFKVGTSGRDMEIESATTGFGKMAQTDELGTLDYEDPLKMYRTTYTHLKYTKGFKVSQELYEDDQHNTIKQMPAALANSIVYTTEFYAASVFNNGFSTSYTSYGDGKPLFSTAHPRVDGGTAQSNASSTGLTFNEVNLETGRLALENALNDKGQIVAFQADQLLVPNALRKAAQIITQSTLRPGTANNDTNVYEGAFKVLVWRYLTSNTQWHIMDSRNHLLKWYWRVKPEFKNDYSFSADAALYKARIRFSYGWSDWRGLWGSKGDSAAYAS